MGRVAVLHQNHHTPSMKSRHRLKSNQNSTTPSKTPVFPVPDNRKQTPLQENRMPKKRDTAAVVATKPAAVTVAKNLGVGQVKILKRGETLEECSTNLKKTENDMKMLSSSYAKIEASKPEEPAVRSASRFGSDPDMVSKQKTKKNVTECFAGFVFFDSPPPSSVPLPGFSFSRKKLVSNVNNVDACSKSKL